MNSRVKVIAIPHPGRSATVAMVAFTGGRYETISNKGISHFVEHMLFKGTDKRGTEDISGAIENCGGDLNGFTDEEITVYHATVPKNKLIMATNVITDMVLNPLFEQKEVNKEKGVIIQELKRHEDSPAARVWEDFNSIFFDAADPLHYPIVGNIQNLAEMTNTKLEEYYKKHYQKLVLVLVGGEGKQEEHWDNTGWEIPIKRNLRNRKDVYLNKQQGIQQSHVVIGNYIDPPEKDRVQMLNKLNLLSAVYNDMSGRLMRVVREKYGLVYGVGFHKALYSDGTIFWGVQLGLDQKKIFKARELIIKELSRPLSKEELKLAYEKRIGDLSLRLDNPLENALAVAYGEEMGINPKELINEEHYARNFKLAAKDINEFVKVLMFKNNLLVGIIPGGIK